MISVLLLLLLLLILCYSIKSSSNDFINHHSSLSSSSLLFNKEKHQRKHTSIIASNQYPFSTQNYYNNQYTSSSSSSSSSPPSSLIKYDKRTLNDFNSIDSRNGFIRKVYSIFTLQIIFTIITTIIIMKSSNISSLLYNNIQLTSLISSLGSLFIISLLIFNSKLRYKYPINIILVTINAILQGLFIGLLSTYIWDPQMLLLGSLHTLTAFLAITIFSLQTKYDLTLLSSSLVTGLSTISIGLILSIIFKMPLAYNVLSGISAIFMALYIAYDTQKIVGGKNTKYPYSQKEYILAAVNLYQDALNLFIYIMRILHNSKNNK